MKSVLTLCLFSTRLCQHTAAIAVGGNRLFPRAAEPVSSSSPLGPWREFEELRESDLDETYLAPFFRERPRLIVNRLFHVSTTLNRARQEWKSTEQEHHAEPATVEDQKNSAATASSDPRSAMDKRELSQAEIDRASKLCESVSSLGPVAVKIGQTLSQRPDLVGVDAAVALKTLQTKNEPFDNELAYGVLHESLDYWEGPLAPGILPSDDRIDRNGPTLFAKMTRDPVACASLGQVYRATMHDGTEIAVKVQRPDALAVLAKDAQCFRTVFRAKGTIERVQNMLSDLGTAADSSTFTEQQVRGKNQTVGSVIDRVARDIKKELDYRIEAKNSVRFKKSLDFLGFVTTPAVVRATDRVLMTEWIPGRHLDKLSREEALAMTRMAVEACTASLVLTGFVHADPHEGNLMLHDDGRIVFLDFGLMSEVDVETMEGFARGIQSLLSEQWSALTEAFVDIGFVTTPIMHRNGLDENWRVDPGFGLPELAEDLALAMQTTEGGESRFGALATILNKKISPYWLVFTPPYVILLIRTFLTLEGIAAAVDPEFNIYEMSMPWAVRRSLSPSTQKGIDVFRSTLLTDENKIQWQRLIDLTSAKIGEEKPTDEQQQEPKSAAAKNAAMKDAVGLLLGTRDGRALRRVLNDLDSADLLVRLSSPDGRPLLEKAVLQVVQRLKNRKRRDEELVSKSRDTVEIENLRPVSKEFARMRLKTSKRRNRALRFLVRSHAKRCLLQWKGIKATLRFLFVSTRVFLQTLKKKKSEKATPALSNNASI